MIAMTIDKIHNYCLKHRKTPRCFDVAWNLINETGPYQCEIRRHQYKKGPYECEMGAYLCERERERESLVCLRFGLSNVKWSLINLRRELINVRFKVI